MKIVSKPYANRPGSFTRGEIIPIVPLQNVASPVKPYNST